MDPPGGQAGEIYDIIDKVFSSIYLLELLTKVILHGPKAYVCGEHRYMNLFDALLICVDIAQFSMELSTGGDAGKVET